MSFSVKKRVSENASAKSIDPHQPAQLAQADLGRNLLRFLTMFSISKDHTTSLFHLFVETDSTISKRYHSTDQASAHASFRMIYLVSARTITVANLLENVVQTKFISKYA